MPFSSSGVDFSVCTLPSGIESILQAVSSSQSKLPKEDYLKGSLGVNVWNLSGSNVKEFACNTGNTGSIPGSVRFPKKVHDNPF